MGLFSSTASEIFHDLFFRSDPVKSSRLSCVLGRAASLIPLVFGRMPAVLLRPTTPVNCRFADSCCAVYALRSYQTHAVQATAVSSWKPSERCRRRSQPSRYPPLEAPPFLFLVYTIPCPRAFVNRNFSAYFNYISITIFLMRVIKIPLYSDIFRHSLISASLKMCSICLCFYKYIQKNFCAAFLRRKTKGGHFRRSTSVPRKGRSTSGTTT